MLGLDARVHAVVLDVRGELLVAHAVQVGTGNGLIGTLDDAQLARDGNGREDVVAGDHDRADAGSLGLGDGVLGLGTDRVDHAAQAQEGHVVLERLGAKVLGLLVVVVDARGRHDAQCLAGHGAVLLHDLLAPLVGQGHVAFLGADLGAVGQHHVGPALGVLDVGPVRSLVNHGHHLAAGVKGRLAHAGVGGHEVGGRKANLGGVGHERGLGGLADSLLAHRVPLGVGGHGHAADQAVLVPAKVAHDRHLVLSERAGLVGADDLGAAQRLHGGELADDRVLLAHLGHAHGQHDRHDRSKALGDGCHGKRDRDHKGVKHEVEVGHELGTVLEEAGEEDDHGDAHDHDGQNARELGELLLQRGLLVLGLAQGVGDLAHLGVHARGHDDGASVAIDHDRAHVAHVLAIAQGHVAGLGVGLQRARALDHRHALTRERCLLDLERRALDQAAVGGHGVAGLKDHDVARHELGAQHLDDLPVTHDTRLRGGHLLKRRQRLLGLGLLDHAEHGVEHDDEQDDDDVGKVVRPLGHAGQGAHHRGDEQHDDHGVGKLRQEAAPHRHLLALLELVQAKLGQAVRGLAGAQTLLRIAALGRNDVLKR